MANEDAISSSSLSLSLSLSLSAVVVAVDHDKNSQHAVRWAMENLRLKDKVIVLVHVATNPSHDLHHHQDDESEMQQLFVPYRGICGRKGVRSKEVVLQKADVAVALSEYLKSHSIKNIVLGAASRGAIARAFRCADVPSSVAKLAPHYCSVYSVSKTKAHKIKSPQPLPNYQEYLQLQLQHHETTPSERSIASTAPSPVYSTTSTTNASQPTSDFPTPTTSFDFHSQCTSLHTKSVAPRRLSRIPPFRPSDATSLYLSADPLSHHSDQHDYPSDISYELLDEATSSHASTSNLAELEDELKRVKLELKLITDKYNTACHVATSTRQKAKDTSDEDDWSNIAETQEVALVMAEREKQNTKAALEIVEKARLLADLESEQRKQAERKFEVEADQKHQVLDAFARSLARCRRYSVQEIQDATHKFRSGKIGEGSYGSVYRASIDHTAVAIKVLKSEKGNGLSQFQQEVEVLSRMRHPNMVILMGACPESGCLVYEYMDNGSLEDRLGCKDGTPHLPWATRFSIAAQIATALNFLHSTRPHPLVHRDLKPANILLDRNYVAKIADLGLSRFIPSASDYHMTAAAGTFCYIDPEYQQTALLGTKSDVYSLGIILLQIITAKSPMGLTHLVKTAIEAGRFAEVVDHRVGGDWPVEETIALAKLGLRCSELMRRDRPSLDAEVVPELERLKDLVVRKVKPERKEYYFTYAESV